MLCEGIFSKFSNFLYKVRVIISKEYTKAIAVNRLRFRERRFPIKNIFFKKFHHIAIKRYFSIREKKIKYIRAFM